MEPENSIATATPAPEASPEVIAANAKIDAGDPGDNTELNEDGTPKEPAKPEKTPEEREKIRMQRGIDRRTRQLAEARAERDAYQRQLSELTNQSIGAHNDNDGNDSEPLSLTRKQLAELVKAEASKLAPTLRTQEAEAEHRQSVVSSLAKAWGQEKFDEIASDLDDAFGGLRDSSGRPKPATDAVFVADNPQRVIEWLANPDNIDDAERMAKLNAAQAGKEIAKLEARFSEADAKAKPKESKAPAPLESVKGRSPSTKSLLDLEGDAFDKRRKEQIRLRR